MNREDKDRMNQLCAWGTDGTISPAEHSELQSLIAKEKRQMDAALAQVNKDFDSAFARRSALRAWESKKTKELMARRDAGEQLDVMELSFLFRMGA